MRISNRIAIAIAALGLVPAAASAGIIGGVQYASQYDYGEFFTVSDHHDFKVVIAGNAFPGSDPGMVARHLLPVMQAAKPRPALTFSYDAVAATNQPDYRLVLVFDAANDLSSKQVCNGESRFKPGRPGLFNAYAVYCRNDRPLSETTAWTSATGPGDPRVAELFREMFMVVFPDSHALKPQVGNGNKN